MPKKYFIFRNSTVERFFNPFDVSFSGYGDISTIPDDADAYFWFYLTPVKTKIGVFISEVEACMQQFQFVLSQLQPHKVCFALTMHNIHHVFHENSNPIITDTITAYNRRLYELTRDYPQLKIIDFSRFCKRYPSSNLLDWKYFYLSQMQLNPKLTDDFTRWLQKEINAIEGKRKKCLALDLDQTLWGGILGEDGVEGIQIGNTYPGSAFLDFQNNLLELSQNGIILTVCSKNNELDVFDAWDKNPHIPINKNRLAAWRINWKNKADNLASLAQELNVGLDSFVFIDDNPAERALVKLLYPMVEAPDFPQQPYLLPAFFEQLCNDYFQIYTITGEDKAKLEQYKANAERATFQQAFTSFEDYLKNLDIIIEIEKPNPVNLSRIAQLTQKTNQFNLTTKRYTEENLQDLSAQGAIIYCIRVIDRFGDNGITGVAILTTESNLNTATIDSFLLSCRILGRQIETVFLKFILLQLKKKGYIQLFATFVPTLKNGQAIDFFDRNGFRLDKTEKNGSKNYSCTVPEFDFTIPDIYTIKYEQVR